MRSSAGRVEARHAAHGAQGRHRAMMRRRAMITSTPLLIVLAGCCGRAPLAEKYFDRDDPLTAVKGFAYAVEATQWDYAYESLTAATREEIGQWKFRAVIGFLSDPIGEVSIYELITNVFAWRSVSRNENRALVRIVSRGQRADGQRLYRALDIEMGFEDEEWRMDLLATAEALAGRMASSWPPGGAPDLALSTGKSGPVGPVSAPKLFSELGLKFPPARADKPH